MFTSEKEMLTELRRVKFAFEIATAQKAQLENQFKALKYIVNNYLLDINAKRTTTYENIGSVTLKAPLIYAELDKEYEEAVFDFVRQAGEPEIIKLSIHPSTLSSFVDRCIEKGLALPGGLSYRFEPSIQCNFVKEEPTVKPANTEA